jgi:predicted metal-dependent phosphoesterase TrpH
VSTVELHCHTTCSDGLLSPEALVERAHARGVRTLAITDHDTLQAWSAALPGARGLGIELLPGVEIGCAHQGGEVHLLGYLVDPNDASLGAMLERTRDDRRVRFHRMLELLAQRGLAVDATELLRQEGTVLGRGQLGRLLVQQRKVATIGEAFRRLLGEGRPCFIAKELPSSAEAIARSRGAGGVAVIAHPGRYARRPRIADLVQEGLGGIEVYYPSHDNDDLRLYFEECARHGLVPTGGSDFHGDPGRPDLGSQPVPEKTVEDLRTAAGR